MKKDRNVWALVFLAAAIFCFPSSAHAGFEWAPPPPPAVAPSMSDAGPMVPFPEGPDAAAMPVPPVDSAMTPPPPGMPEPVSIDPYPAGGTPGALRAPVLPAPGMVVSAPDASSSPFAAYPPPMSGAPVSATDGKQYETVSGFGDDIPLAMVMRQIIPASYAYSFDPSVNPGVKVSWRGERPWNVVLSDALAAKGMTMTIKDNMVRVSPAAMMSATARPAMMAPPPSDTMMPEFDVPPSSAPAPAYEKPDYAAIGRDDSRYEPSYPRRARPPVSLMPGATSSASEFSGGEMASAAPAPMDSSGMKIARPSYIYSPPSDGAAAFSGASGSAAHSTAALPRTWTAEKGESLRYLLMNWSALEGVDLYWEPEQDYNMPEAIQASGSYADAVGMVLAAYEADKDRPLGRLYPTQDDSGKPVLVIQSSESVN